MKCDSVRTSCSLSCLNARKHGSVRTTRSTFYFLLSTLYFLLDFRLFLDLPSDTSGGRICQICLSNMCLSEIRLSELCLSKKCLSEMCHGLRPKALGSKAEGLQLFGKYQNPYLKNIGQLLEAGSTFWRGF